MTKKNKFGIEPVSVPTGPRIRSLGPMSTAVREASDSLYESTEAKVEQRRRNAEDAKAYRAAAEEGRVLVNLALDEIATTALPRDRMDLAAVAQADEMEELKASIRARGQKEPIEVFRDAEGALQLKKGWRRLTALRQLLDETGDEAFATVLARVDDDEAAQLERYVDMVEENVVREDLTFAEMAWVVIEAGSDSGVEEKDVEVLISRLYGALHKRKRSYIRSFVYLLSEIGEALKFPKAVSRNLGADVSRKLQADGGRGELMGRLRGVETAEEQRAVLEDFLAARPRRGRPKAAPGPRDSKFSFKVGAAKVTAKKGECRIVMDVDFTDVPRDTLERAIQEFHAAIKG